MRPIRKIEGGVRTRGWVTSIFAAAVAAASMAAGASCASPTPAATPANQVTRATLLPAPRTCLPGRFVAELAVRTADCPAAPVGWRVLKHRSAVATLGDRDTKPPTARLVAATCSYTWVGKGPAPDGVPVRSPLLPTLSSLCIDEPPPPDQLMSRACPAGIQIGRNPDGPGCPKAAGWRADPLFPGKTGELARYCSYAATTFEHTDGLDVEIIPLTTSLEHLPDWVHADCAGVGALAIPTDRVQMEQAYAGAAEALTPLPLLAGGAQPDRVRVAVVDSALDGKDDGLPGAGRSTHGRAMGELIAHMGCPDRKPGSQSACIVDVRTHPALWLVRHPNGYARDSRGGFLGLRSDLARAIVAAVDSAPADGHLVVNVSLGWSRLLGGGEAEPKDFAADVGAVYAAIEYARCHGALVIAAAGNASGFPATPLGPLYPGQWETRPAPTRARCDDLDVTPPPSWAPGGPLLYAVGGVDALDQPLFNTPLLGRPRLAAPAANVIVPDGGPAVLQTMGGRTGSSAAAALASAAAAIVWSYQRGWNADAVMEAIYQAGVDLAQPASFCFGGAPCDPIHRISICRTVRAACAGDPGVCDGLPPCLKTGARTTLAQQPDFAALRPDPCALPAPDPACLPRAPSPLDPVHEDAWQFPFVERQPINPICSVCGAGWPGGLLVLNTNPPDALAPDYRYATQQLRLRDQDGYVTISINDPSIPPIFAGPGGSNRAGVVDLSPVTSSPIDGTVTFATDDWDGWSADWYPSGTWTDNLYFTP